MEAGDVDAGQDGAKGTREISVAGRGAMVTAHSFAVDRDKPGVDWRASLAVVLVHVLFFIWLLRSPLSEPIRSTLTPLVIMELWTGATADDPPAPPLDKPLTAKAAPSHARNAAPAMAARSPLPHDRPVVAEGNTAASSAVLPGAPVESTAPPASVVDGSTSSAGPTQGGRLGSGGRFHAPRVIARTRLSYPADAYLAEKQGTVAVMVTVGVDGDVIETHVHESSGSASLDRAAVDAVAHWTFKAAEREGHPTEAQAIVNIDWRIGASTHLTFDATALPSQGSKAVQSRGCIISNAAHPELCTAPNPVR
ncbi:MAG: TonB family protein [Dokdonella sp.]